MNEAKRVTFLKGDEAENLEKLDLKVGGKTKGDVPLAAIREARRLGLLSMGDAFRAVTAVFRADNRKPRASEIVDDSES